MFVGINEFQFAYNNPVFFNDPTGLATAPSMDKPKPKKEWEAKDYGNGGDEPKKSGVYHVVNAGGLNKLDFKAVQQSVKDANEMLCYWNIHSISFQFHENSKSFEKYKNEQRAGLIVIGQSSKAISSYTSNYPAFHEDLSLDFLVDHSANDYFPELSTTPRKKLGNFGAINVSRWNRYIKDYGVYWVPLSKILCWTLLHIVGHNAGFEDHVWVVKKTIKERDNREEVKYDRTYMGDHAIMSAAPDVNFTRYSIYDILFDKSKENDLWRRVVNAYFNK